VFDRKIARDGLDQVPTPRIIRLRVPTFTVRHHCRMTQLYSPTCDGHAFVEERGRADHYLFLLSMRKGLIVTNSVPYLQSHSH
jgi:hypothetical protein